MARYRSPGPDVHPWIQNALAGYQLGAGLREGWDKRRAAKEERGRTEARRAAAAIPEEEYQPPATEQETMLQRQSGIFGEGWLPKTSTRKTWEQSEVNYIANLEDPSPENIQAAKRLFRQGQHSAALKGLHGVRTALQNGDMQGAARLVEEAYANMPDGHRLIVRPRGDVLIGMPFDEETGERGGRPTVINTQMLDRLIDNFSGEKGLMHFDYWTQAGQQTADKRRLANAKEAREGQKAIREEEEFEAKRPYLGRQAIADIDKVEADAARAATDAARSYVQADTERESREAENALRRARAGYYDRGPASRSSTPVIASGWKQSEANSASNSIRQTVQQRFNSIMPRKGEPMAQLYDDGGLRVASRAEQLRFSNNPNALTNSTAVQLAQDLELAVQNAATGGDPSGFYKILGLDPHMNKGQARAVLGQNLRRISDYEFQLRVGDHWVRLSPDTGKWINALLKQYKPGQRPGGR